MPKLIEKKDCTGCSACANICPKTAISMSPDEEGFINPIIDYDKCIECKACERVCPGLKPVYNEDANLKVYLAQNRNDEIRYESTSGGAFTAIASHIITHRKGFVFGASMDENFDVSHMSVDNISDLSKFRNSKYVQSKIADSYVKVRELLQQGKYVCFSGTPCQINGLYKFLGRDYDNLITVDVVCKSVPSPLIFEKYIQFKKRRESKISDVVFRDKKRGFLYCTMAHYKSEQNKASGKASYRRGSESDEWLRLFLSGKICRKSCMNCQYQTKERMADFTLGDIWTSGNKNFDDNKGTTLLHVWSKKGEDLLKELSDLKLEHYPIHLSRGYERKGRIQEYAQRKQLFLDAKELDVEVFFKKYSPYNLKIKAKNYARFLLWKLNIQGFVRNIKHNIIHRK